MVLIRLVEPGLNERALLSQSLGRTTDQLGSLLFFFFIQHALLVLVTRLHSFFVYIVYPFTLLCVCVCVCVS